MNTVETLEVDIGQLCLSKQISQTYEETEDIEPNGEIQSISPIKNHTYSPLKAVKEGQKPLKIDLKNLKIYNQTDFDY